MALGRWRNTAVPGSRLGVHCNWHERQLAGAGYKIYPRHAGFQGTTGKFGACLVHVELGFGLAPGAELGHLARAGSYARNAAPCVGWD